MKVEIGKVTRVSGADFGVEFKIPADVRIPVGSKVTVEWDDSVHECEKMKAYGRFLKRMAGIWFIMKDSRDGDWAVCEALYCPGCGKDLR